MDDKFKEIFGAVVAAIGTILSAVASFPSETTRIIDLYKDFDIVGNTLQAVGNALQADGQKEPSLEKLGNEIQSIGNSTVLAGLVWNIEDDSKEKLIITGNWLQALGGAVALGDEFNDPTAAGQIYNINGNLLQSIGNSLQAIGGSINLKEKQLSKEEETASSGDSIIFAGSWIQAVGSVLSAIGQVKEES